MRELLILRHGKSDWPPGVDDFDRPLKSRGKRAATKIGHWLLKHDLVPNRILSSPAERAIRTAERVCTAMDLENSCIEEVDGLYLASRETLLTVLRSISEPTKRALIVGHNPGLEELLMTLSDAKISPNDGSGRMPTAALAVLKLSTKWNAITTHSATIMTLIRPKQLPLMD